MKLVKPETWTTKALGDLATLTLGGDWGQASEFESDDYSAALCIRGAEFRNWNDAKGATASLRKIKKSSLASRALRVGDILVEISGGGPDQPVGRTVLVDKIALSHSPDLPKICTNFVRLLRPSEEVDPRFLNLYLQFFYESGEIRDYQAGSNNLRNLKFKDYLGLEIPFPPLSEQTRIVAKTEELFSELDNGVETLKTVRAQLKVYRDALLKHAYDGKLSASWRAHNPTNLKTLDEVRAHIQRERTEHYQQQLAEWEAAVAPGIKPKSPKNLPAMDADELAKLSPLPKGWSWIRLEYLVTGIDQGWSPKCDSKPAAEADWGVIKTTAVQHGKFLGAENKALPEGLKPRLQHELKVNDILITRAGPRVRVGVCCLVRAVRKNLMNCDKVYRIKSLEPICLPAYLEGALNSPRVLDAIEGIKSGINDSGVNLNQGAFLNLYIPYCSLREQEETLKELDQKLSVLAKVEQTVATSLDQAKALRQSVLKKAFSGQLVPQDRDDHLLKTDKPKQSTRKKARK